MKEVHIFEGVGANLVVYIQQLAIMGNIGVRFPIQQPICNGLSQNPFFGFGIWWFLREQFVNSSCFWSLRWLTDLVHYKVCCISLS